LTCKVILTNLEKMMRKVLKWKLLTLCLLSCVSRAAGEYDPLSESASGKGQTTELLVKDESRQREIPLKVYLPEVADSSPIVLFSHGLGGTRDGCAYLGKHWSARGYVVVFLQHSGSDDSVWKDAPLQKRMAAMQQAASPQNFLLRVRDVPAVLDQLEKWNKDSQHVVGGRLDIQRVGMSGHSFGAVTTQAVSGQSYPPLGPKFTDARIKAAIALSPSSPRSGDPKRAFGRVKIPWLLMTGTKDASPIGGQTIESRMAVYPMLPGGIDKYELVLHNAEHSAFSDRALPGDSEPRNPSHHRAILALSTAFWDAHLRNDDNARAWLHGVKGRSALESQDRWQLQLHSQ
jgi:predicted dienelactone hydrolase